MKIYLAGTRPCGNGDEFTEIIRKEHPFLLDSFYYMNATTVAQIPYMGSFMLDSGAFTFIQNSHGEEIVWEEYIDRYADFVRKQKIALYLELDIDAVVGYDRVKLLRKRLEYQVGWQSIPVWHKNRGIDEYKRMCQEFPYVAIGGYVIKELTPKEYENFPPMIKYAHQHGAKVHGLGYTALRNLNKHRFDSVDSTTWLCGNRFGYYCWFDGKTIVKKFKPDGKRVRDPKHCGVHNFKEWIKFQKWADTHL